MPIAAVASGINKPKSIPRPPRSTDTSADMFRIREDEELGGMGQTMLGKQEEEQEQEPEQPEMMQPSRAQELRSQQQNGMRMNEELATQRQEQTQSPTSSEPSSPQQPKKAQPEQEEDDKEKQLREVRETILDSFLQAGYASNMTILLGTCGAAFPIVALPLLGILFMTFIQVFVGKLILKNKSTFIPGASYHGLTAPLKIIDPYGMLIYANAIQKFIFVSIFFIVAFGMMMLILTIILSPGLLLAWGFNEVFGTF